MKFVGYLDVAEIVSEYHDNVFFLLLNVYEIKIS